MNKDLFDIATMLVAVAGLVLGVTNYITDLLRRRPRAKISFRHYQSTLEGYIGIGATVLNDGEVPFTVCDVCFELGGDDWLKVLLKEGDALPKVLHPGEYCEVILPRRSCLDAQWGQIKGIVVRLPAGKYFRSKRFTRKFLSLESELDDNQG